MTKAAALIIVDVQNDFLPGGALGVAGGDEVPPMINALQGNYAIITATQDWHPLEHGSFAVNHAGRQVGEEIELGGQRQMLWPMHCVQGTLGADFSPGLDTSRFTAIFRKGTDPLIDSYSGFFDNGHKRSTGLAEFLKRQGVVAVDVVGLATDYCVKFTALDAIASGFAVRVLTAACRAVNLHPGDGDAALQEMQHAGAVIV